MTLYPPIKVGSAEVYLSGTVICRTGQIIELTPVPTALIPFRLQLMFTDNPFMPAQISVNNLPSNVVLVTIANAGTVASSTSAPLNVGNVGGVPLMLDVAAYTTGDQKTLARVVTFTVLKGAP